VKTGAIEPSGNEPRAICLVFWASVFACQEKAQREGS
jgi:hypothetical protein